MSRIHKESKSLRLNYKCYCAYCGKECKNDEELYDHDWIDHYYCECEDACKEMEINKQIFQLLSERDQEIRNVSKPYNIKIRDLEQELPEEKYSVQTKILRNDK